MDTPILFLKKFVFTLLFFLPTLAFAHIEPTKTAKEKTENESKRMEIKNKKIASETAFKFEVKEGLVVQNSQSKYLETLYNVDGTIADMLLYKTNGKIDVSVHYTYDSFFNMKTETDKDSLGNVTDSIAFEYDTNHCIIRQKNYLGEQWDSEFTYQKDYNKNILTFTKTLADKSIDYQLIYQYDQEIENGNNTTITKQKMDGTLQMRVENIFDTHNKRTHKKIFDAENDLMYYFTYEYESNGDFKTISRYTPDNKLFNRIVYQYNTHQLLENISTFNAENQLISYVEYTYQYYQ